MPIGPRTHESSRLEIAAVDLPLLPSDLGHLRLVKNVFTPAAKRRQGDARWLMCEVCVEADRTRTVLMLEPRPDEDDAPLDADALENWYHGFGFKVAQREPVTFMARQPR